MVGIAPGAAAPPVPGVDFAAGPAALWFAKSDCSVCVLASPVVARLAAVHPGRVTVVGQDRVEDLEAFATRNGLEGVPRVVDGAPYEISEAYEVESTPTLYVVAPGGTIALVVASWDREGYNAASAALGELGGGPGVAVSEPGDGLPSFRPG